MDKNIIEETSRRILEFRSRSQAELQWLYDLRKQAWEYFQTGPLPNRSSHLWRYSDYKIYEPVDQDESGEFPAFSRDLPEIIRIPAELRSKGVVYDSLLSVSKDNPELLEKYFGSLIGPDFGRYEALNMAIWDKGRFLYIPDNVRLDHPIEIATSIRDGFSAQRLLIIVGESSEVSIVESYGSQEEKTNGTYYSAIELIAGDNSSVNYINMQNVPGDSDGHITFRARTGADGRIYSMFGGFGGKHTKVNSGVELSGRGAESRIDGILFGHGSQTFDYHTRHHHTAGNTFSNLDFKVALMDKAKSAYTGLIRIEDYARGCEAYQENRNLLLNEGARADSIPELEILTDEVKCTHGATMGPIDPEMIFYLKSRGIPRAEAIRMVVEGFISPILARIPEAAAVTIGDIAAEKLESIIK